MALPRGAHYPNEINRLWKSGTSNRSIEYHGFLLEMSHHFLTPWCETVLADLVCASSSTICAASPFAGARRISVASRDPCCRACTLALSTGPSQPTESSQLASAVVTSAEEFRGQQPRPPP